MNPSDKGPATSDRRAPRRIAYSPREVADLTGLTYRKVLDLCVDGRLRHRRAGSLYVIPVDAVDEFFAGDDAA